MQLLKASRIRRIFHIIKQNLIRRMCTHIVLFQLHFRHITKQQRQHRYAAELFSYTINNLSVHITHDNMT